MKLTNRCLYVYLYVSLIRLSLLNLTRGLLLLFFLFFTVLLFILLSFKDSFLFLYIKFEEIQESIIILHNFSFFPPRFFSRRERKLQDEHFSQMQISHATEHDRGDSPGEVYRRIKGTIIFKAITQGRPVKRNIS